MKKVKIYAAVVFATLFLAALVFMPWVEAAVEGYFNVSHDRKTMTVASGGKLLVDDGATIEVEGTLRLDGATVLGSIGASGTLSGTTITGTNLDINGDADISGTCNADTLVTSGFQINDFTGNPVQVAKNDLIPTGVTTGATTDEIDGSTLVVGASVFDPGDAIDIDCYGLSNGANGDKQVLLYAGSTVLQTLQSQVASDGSWKAEFSVAEFTDTANQATIGTLLMPGGTVDTFVPAISATTIDMTAEVTFTVKIATPDSTADEMTLYACFWTFRDGN